VGDLLAIRNLARVHGLTHKRYCDGVQRSHSGSLSKLSGLGGRRSVTYERIVPTVAVAGLIAPAAWLLTGCSAGPDLMSTVVLPSEQTPGSVGGDATAAAPDPGSQAKLELTSIQRGYLDALVEAGIDPPTQLRALSIGSYVCQARAAGQSPEAVREYVAPMVRSDIADANASTPQSAAVIGADAAIDGYIRIAGQRLC
jgi:hypothetical protein